MKNQLIAVLLGALLQMLNPETLKRFADAGLDAIEDAVAESENTWDDMVVLPLCSQIRVAFDIPDNDVPA